MSSLYVYEPWPDAVDTMGLCGPIVPTKATCTQEKNGDFRLDIEHPIDRWDKWANLVPGNLIRADVPMRTLPQMEYGTTNVIPFMRRATVKNVSRSARAVYPWYGSGTTDLRLYTLDVGMTVYEVEVLTVGGPYTNVRWSGGNGWILRSSLENFVDISMPSPTVTTLESYIPPLRARMQLFRINSRKMTEKGVTIGARHVFYDQQGNLTNFSATNVSADAALQGIDAGKLTNKVDNHVGGTYQTNLVGAKDVDKWVRTPYAEAFLSPSNGILAYWTGDILRDNWDFALVDSATLDRGVTIEYGKNLIGVTYSEDDADIITGLLPVGQTSKGKPLVLPNDYYNVLAYTQKGVIYSPHEADYPVPHLAPFDLGTRVKATGTTSGALNTAYGKMFTATMDEFARSKCDLPQVTLAVDFLLLGDTAEHAQYRDLQKVLLLDTVRVGLPRLGVDVSPQVNKTVWNFLTERYDSVEVGTVRKGYARSRLAGWQIPDLAALKAYVSTISDLV